MNKTLAEICTTIFRNDKYRIFIERLLEALFVTKVGFIKKILEKENPMKRHISRFDFSNGICLLI